ncbi:MAG: adenine deaminase [Aureispira sp.]
MKLRANYVDILHREIYPAELHIEQQKIKSITRLTSDLELAHYVIPGFVDAHVHVESSMLVPSEFARLAVRHGTVGTVSDPHEIANVLGIPGVEYMLENAATVPFKFNFGAPSCVPATSFESAGAVIDPEGVAQLLARPDIKYLAEVMNYPGVIHRTDDMMDKIAAAKAVGKPIDGHAPGVVGKAIQQYIAAGITTDHECFTLEEALEKLSLGMKILIREGSAAKNFEALIGLLPQYTAHIMFCSDDKHPDDLLVGHINQLAARAVAKGISVFDVLQAACINPVAHYNLDIGTLKEGDWADFVLVHDLQDFEAHATYINGELVAKEGRDYLSSVRPSLVNQFNATPKTVKDFALEAEGEHIQVIQAIDGALITKKITRPTPIHKGLAVSDSTQDILKIAVINRYQDAPPALAFINGFSLKEGAIASCVGHDSHNIIVVGVSDDAICQAVNLIIQHQGGIAAVGANDEQVLPLPIAGILSDQSGETVATAYSQLDQFVKTELGCSLRAPFMTLSFMALLVIPNLKLSDQGLFDGGSFEFTPLFV